MEMTTGCLRPEPARQPGRPVRGPHGGWQKQEIEALQKSIDEAEKTGESLRSVFDRLGCELGRKPNSIRNYYYACLRQQGVEGERTPAFRPFTQEETHELLRQVLMARGKGMSVRACVMALSEGSHSRMLRYQNKYRTILKTRPELIAQVCEELRAEGLPCPNTAPLTPVADHADAAFCDPEDAAAARLMAEPCVHHMLEGLKELLRRAARSEASPDEKLREKCAELQRTVDRQQVQFDLQRIAWEKDYNDCADHLRRVMVALGRETSAGEDALDVLQNAENFLRRQAEMTH